MKKKVGIVFSGEGARGSYQAGVLRRLLNDGVRPDVLYGTSSGAMNAVGYSYMGIDLLEKTWRQLGSIDKVFKSHGLACLWRDGMYSVDPLRKIVTAAVLGRNQAPKPVTVSKVDLLTGDLSYVCNTTSRPEAFIEAVLASAAIPGLVEPVEGRWTDGGTKVRAPLKRAVEDGVTDLHVIMASPPKPDPWSEIPALLRVGPFKLFKCPMVAYRAMGLTLHQLMIQDVQTCHSKNQSEHHREIDLHVYGPKSPLWSPTDFSETPYGFNLGYSQHAEFDLADL